MLPVLSKIFERLLVNRPNDLTADIMNDRQYGFRPGRSTVDAWIKTRNTVEESRKKYVLGIFVDFKGAFDNISWPSIIRKLTSINSKELAMWKSYFQDSYACVSGTVDVVWKKVERGCPQGSVSGPVIWNLCMDDLLQKLMDNDYDIVAYADDLLILIQADNRAELERNAISAMELVVDWGEDVGVSVSWVKTNMMLLKGRLSDTRTPNVRIRGQKIKHVKKVKYLGINVAERLSFKPHLSYLREKVTNIIGGMRRVLRKDWGLGRRAVRIIYKGAIVPCITYASGVWYDWMKYGYARGMISSAQRVVLNASLRVCRTVSTDAMRVLMGVWPWEEEIVRSGVRYKIKRGIRLNGGVDMLSSDEMEGMNKSEQLKLLDNRINEKLQREWDNATMAGGRINS